jgi:histidinol phosphatase-like enzyme
MPEVVLVAGCNGSGKTTFTNQNFKNHHRINRDTIGGKLDNLDLHLEKAIQEGKDRIVLDNTYKTVASRKSVMDMAKKHSYEIRCFWLTTTTDQAMINVCMRMMEKYNRILSPDEIKAESKKDPGIFPVAAIFGFHSKKEGNGPEQPSKAEGFNDVITVSFMREWPKDWTNKGVIFDYDDTLRYVTNGGVKFPTEVKHVAVYPNRAAVIQKWKDDGYSLFGASNQSGIAKGTLTEEMAKACFEETNKLLGFDIPVNYCPHIAGAAICYCRKPAPGLLIDHMWKHKLDPKTCAIRLGIRYFHESEFFKA